MEKNHIISPYSAIVDGQNTGLAGCTDAEGCPKAKYCLRSSPELLSRAQHRLPDEDCRFLIPNALSQETFNVRP